jgi:hypothetical protein
VRTGDRPALLGLYKTECCDYELILDTEECFPRCLKCQHFSEWQLVEQVYEALPFAA